MSWDPSGQAGGCGWLAKPAVTASWPQISSRKWTSTWMEKYI